MNDLASHQHSPPDQVTLVGNGNRVRAFDIQDAFQPADKVRAFDLAECLFLFRG